MGIPGAGISPPTGTGRAGGWFRVLARPRVAASTPAPVISEGKRCQHIFTAADPPQASAGVVVFMNPVRLTLDVSPAVPEDVAKYARLVALIQRCGTVLSRIKVHKILYVLKSLGYPVRERFEYRHYGPYSVDLAAELRSAVNATYLQERVTETPGEEDEEPYRRYDYSPGRRGSELFASVASSDPTLAAVAESMSGVAEELNESPPTRLELIATLMYLQDQNVPRDLIVGVLQASKPQFTESEIRVALEYIADLRSRASFTPPLDLSSIIGLVKEGPPSDAAQDLDEEIYGGE